MVRGLAGVMRGLVLGLVLLVGVSACAPAPAPEEPIAADAVLIDVRTPAEFAEGHLAGAVNIDLQSGSFEQEIAALPLAGDYVVYCRSGNRSGQAVEIMRKLGFDNLVNAGGLQDASRTTGAQIVTGE